MSAGRDVEGGQQHSISDDEGERLLVGQQCETAGPPSLILLPSLQQQGSRRRNHSGWGESAAHALQWVRQSTLRAHLQPIMASTAPHLSSWQQRLASCRASCQGAAARTRITVLVCLVLISAALTQFLNARQLQSMVEQLQQARLVSIVVFVLLFAAAVVLLLPGMLLSIGAGAAYGFYIGFTVAWLGTVLGQVGAFTLGRYLLRDVVYTYMVQKFPGFSVIDQNIGQDGWKMVLLLRLSPVLPYNIMNYALGVTSIQLLPYTLSSATAAIPYVCLFAYLGSSSADLYQLLHDGAQTQLSPELLIFLSCVMILSVVGLFFLCKRAVQGTHQPVPSTAESVDVRAAIAQMGQFSDSSSSISSSSRSSSRVLILRA